MRVRKALERLVRATLERRRPLNDLLDEAEAAIEGCSDPDDYPNEATAEVLDDWADGDLTDDEVRQKLLELGCKDEELQEARDWLDEQTREPPKPTPEHIQEAINRLPETERERVYLTLKELNDARYKPRDR